jgi:hypothetical protein
METRYYEHLDGFFPVLKDLRFGDLGLPFENVIEAPDQTTVRRHHEVVLSTLDVEERFSGSTAWTGLLAERSDVADTVAKEGNGIGRQSRHEKRSANTLIVALDGIDFNNAEFHIYV